MGNLKFIGIKFNENLIPWICFDKHLGVFRVEVCANIYIYLYSTFSVLQYNVSIFLINWTYYLQNDAFISLCVDITNCGFLLSASSAYGGFESSEFQ